MDEPWEAVLTMDDWYDGPRVGVAHCQGSPHYYRSLYLDAPKWNPDEDRFELTPLSPIAVNAALELETIWERWHNACRSGKAPENPNGERVLPEDRERRVELETLLAAECTANAGQTCLVHGEFELGCKRVRWRPVL